MSSTPRHTPACDDPCRRLLQVAISRTAADAVLLAPAGEADLCTAPILRRAVGDALASRPRLMVVDLNELTFLDATTLGVLVEARRRLKAHGGSLRIRADRPLTRQLLAIAGLDAVLDATDGQERSMATCPG